MSCSLHDVVTLESRGIPTVAIGTAPFREEAREQAEALGMPDYEMLELPHPIQPIPIEEVVGLADIFVDRIVAGLTSPITEA